MTHSRFRTTRQIVNLREGRNDWYRVVQAKAGAPTQVMIYDEIGFFGITAQDFVRDLADISGPVELHLSSPGGEVFDGIAIYNALKQRDGEVRVIVDSLAASISSVIAMAASPGQLAMARNATMMIHDGFGVTIGNAADMRETADLLDKTSDNIASIYADRTGTPVAQWRAAMLSETWYSAQEAVDAGLADSILGAVSAPPKNTWDLSVFKGGLTAPVPTNKAIAVHHEPVVAGAWDGPAAVAAMPAEYADLHYCHAWQSGAADASSHTPGDDDVDDRKGSFKFPHHKVKGGPAFIAGVNNAMARLDAADIPEADKAGVKAHLAAHQADYHDDTADHIDPQQFSDWLREAFNAVRIDPAAATTKER